MKLLIWSYTQRHKVNMMDIYINRYYYFIDNTGRIDKDLFTVHSTLKL